MTALSSRFFSQMKASKISSNLIWKFCQSKSLYYCNCMSLIICILSFYDGNPWITRGSKLPHLKSTPKALAIQQRNFPLISNNLFKKIIFMIFLIDYIIVKRLGLQCGHQDFLYMACTCWSFPKPTFNLAKQTQI